MTVTVAALISIPNRVRSLVEECGAAGGRAVLVGGCVRDALLGREPADLDVEVHGLAVEALRQLARRHGRVDEVGRAFGVLKVRLGDEQIDLSVPRRDSKAGAGHRGIRVDADPHLGWTEAARRRDLTVNAIAWDPLNGELIDPFGGHDDLRAGKLRAVDAETFAEDPLRALRVAQFVARFGFEVVPALAEQCRTMDVSGLPAERVRGEVEKLLLKGVSPAAGWAFAHETFLWRRLAPEWDAPAPPRLDQLAHAPIAEAPRRFALLLAATAPPAPLESLLDRLRIHAWLGYDVRTQALALARAAQVASDPRDALTRARWAAEVLEVELLALLQDDPALAAAAEALGVGRAPLLPLLGGRDLLELGLAPGAALGALLRELRAAQLDGHVSSPEAALEWARTRLR